MNYLRSAILVGVLLIAAGIGLAFFVGISGRKGLRGSETYAVHMTFPDASGLAKRSRVVIAGIDIGKIDKIELVRRSAVVTIRVTKDVPLYEDASVEKRSESLLGDSLLDIDPGTEGKPRIPDGGEIKNVRTAGGMDQVMASAQRVMDNTEKVTGSLAEAIGSQQGKEDISDIVRQLAETTAQVNRATARSAEQVARILGHIEKLTGQISQIAPAQEEKVAQILTNMKEISEQTKRAIGAVNAVIDKQGDNVDTAMKQVHDALEKLDKTLASAQQVIGDVEHGEGPVGVLLHDKQMGDQIKHVVNEATDIVDRVTGLKVEVVGRSAVGMQPRGNGTWAYPTLHTYGVRIKPAKSSRYLELDAVSDSRGTVEHQVQVINDQTLLTDTYAQGMRYNLWLAQNWGPATFRVGLFESTGGVGFDYDIFPSTLAVHTDVFDFNAVNGAPFPRVRVSAQYTFLNNFDLYVGGDDLMNGPQRNFDPSGILTGGGRTGFIGAGFHLTDDDIRALLLITGIPKP